MASEKVCLASADGHVGPPTEVYKGYLAKCLHSEFDEYLAHHVWRWAPQSKDSFFPAEKNAKFWKTEGFDPSRGTPVVWDPALRLKAMDQAMIACELLLPDDQNKNDPPWGSGLANAMVEGPTGSNAYPPELVRAGAGAYNRWLAEFCSADPARLRGVTVLGTLDDVVWAVEELQRAYESGLRTGVMLPLDYYLPLYHHPRYDILWETCSELNLSLVTHVSRGHPHYLGEDPLMQAFLYGHEAGWYAQRPFWCLIMSGALERFPNLRLVATEIFINWVAPLLQVLDVTHTAWSQMQASRDVTRRADLSMKPSEYWKRQCFVTHSINQKHAEFEGEAYDSVPNMVFGADLGHDEGWWPVFGFPEPKPGIPGFDDLPIFPVEEAVKGILGGLPASKMLGYLQDNFFRAYPNVDRNALQGVVDRIGLTTTGLGLV